MTKLWASLKPALPGLAVDAVGVGGGVSVAFGLYEIYPPAAWIAAGLAMIAGAWLLAKRAG
jgi:hypothetical protein